jgi:hypothetical protein
MAPSPNEADQKLLRSARLIAGTGTLMPALVFPTPSHREPDLDAGLGALRDPCAAGRRNLDLKPCCCQSLAIRSLA